MTHKGAQVFILARMERNKQFLDGEMIWLYQHLERSLWKSRRK
jgi:hypothetical protein